MNTATRRRTRRRRRWRPASSSESAQPHLREGTMEDAVTDPAVKQQKLDAGRGATWWTESWTLFMKNPGMWLVFGVIFIVGFAVLHFIPVIGGLIAAALGQVIAGGWMLSARKLDSGGTLEVADLFS